MKILIASDLHIGGSHYRKLDSNGLNRYMMKNLEVVQWIADYARSNNISTIMIPGDVFDKSNPITYVVVKVNEIFEGLSVHALKGNHDDSTILHSEEICAINAVPNLIPYNTAKNIVIDNVNFAFVPWMYEVDDSLIDPSRKNVLIAHAYPSEAKGLLYRSSSSESLLSDKRFLFDLVITGHEHGTDIFTEGKTTFLNPGSINPSFSVRNHKPSIFILETEDLSFEQVPIENSLCIIHETPIDIDEYLNNINDENIYRLVSDRRPDKKALMKAQRKAIDVQVEVVHEKAKVKKVEDFWQFINESYPQYESEFRQNLGVESSC